MTDFCNKPGHAGGPQCVTCAEHKTFRDAATRRRDAGIRLRRVCFMAQESQVVAFNELWESYVERWGKTKAVDVLIRIMSRVEVVMRDSEHAKKPKPVKFVRVSAPRVE